jgi:hypothetical protein
MRALIMSVIVVTLVAAVAFAQGPTTNALNIYLIDVEGGNAQLYVTPSGASVLIDSGNGGAGARATRIGSWRRSGTRGCRASIG